jgi:hypothetical protein
MSNDVNTTTITMNEMVMQQALHDLQVAALQGPTESIALLCDHTGKFPVLSTTAIAITAAEAMAAFTRYLTAVGLEWKWATENLVFTDVTPSTLGHLLNEMYPVGGTNPRTVGALAYGLMKVRRTEGFVIRRAKNNLAVATLQADGGAYYAEGATLKDGTQIGYAVVDKDGNPNLNASEKKARKAWAREHYGPKWWGEMVDGKAVNHPDKAERLAAAIVQRGPFASTELSEGTEKVRAGQAPTPAAATTVASTIAPTTIAPAISTIAHRTNVPNVATTIAEVQEPVQPAEVQSTSTASVTEAQAIAMAKTLGSQAKTMTGALTYLAGKGVNL